MLAPQLAPQLAPHNPSPPPENNFLHFLQAIFEQLTTIQRATAAAVMWDASNPFFFADVIPYVNVSSTSREYPRVLGEYQLQSRV